MLVVIAIIGIITPALYGSILSLYRTHAHTYSQGLALYTATRTVQEIIRDVRGAAYAENGSLPLVDIASSTVTVYTDTDFDGKVERVRYFLSGTTVQKGVVEPTATSSYPLDSETVVTLAGGIVNGETGASLFRYYTATSTEITSTANILDVRRIEVLLDARSPVVQNSAQVTVHSSASIRNLKDAY